MATAREDERPADAVVERVEHEDGRYLPPNRSESKLMYLGGSEAGAGAFINDTLPEETAARLREAAGS